MDFGILGALEVRQEGLPLPLGGYKQRSLLAILLSQANQFVAASRLVDLIWGDGAPETANHGLEVYVSQLRKVLEPKRARGAPYQVLLSGRSGYMVKVEAGQLDLDRYLQAVAEARQAAAAGRPEAAADRFGEASGLWRGPAYADFASEPFAMAERARLDELRMRATEDRLEVELQLGRHADLVGELESLVSEHPLRERLCGQLMLALYRSGRQAEASDRYQKTRERLVEEQGMEPGPELQELLRRILKQDPSLEPARESKAARHTNLPHQLTSFVGRRHEIQEVTELLSRHRLVTLTGAGGVGKTRLAIEVAGALRDGYPDGVWLVELASLGDGRLIGQTIVSVLGLTQAPGRTPIEVLIGHARTRQLLLLLDNCEHLVQAAAEVVDSLLKTCPELRVLATSRELLRLGAETGWRVPSLAAPPARPLPVSELKTFEAVQLFCERAASALGSFTLGELDALPVVAVCARLDGIPLAIELAAARLRLLSLEQLAARLEDRLHLLTAGERAASPRQRTLRATIEWSYDLLDEPEKVLFERLSIFAGPFGLVAAEAVVPGGVIESTAVVDLLGRLVDKSLVVVERSSEEAAYRLLETLREFGRERLAERGGLEEMGRRHAKYFCGLGEQARPALIGADQAATLARLEAALDNLRAALSWASSTDPSLGLRAAAGLIMFWATKGLYVEGRRWMGVFLAADAPAELRVLALNGAGLLAQAQGDLDAALLSYRQSLDLAERAADDWACARAQNNIGGIVYLQGDFDAARVHFEESLAVLRRIGTPYQIGSILINLCLLALGVGDAERARRLVEESLALFRQVGERDRTALCNMCLARVNVLEDRLDEALKLASESLQIFRELGDRSEESVALRVLGDIALRRGELDEAGRLFADSLVINLELGVKVEMACGLEALAELASRRRQAERSLRLVGAAGAFRDSIGAPLEPIDRRRMAAIVALAKRAIGREAAKTALDAGSSLGVEDAIAEALADPVPAALTARSAETMA